MLIGYEYELLSYVLYKGIKKTNKDIVISFKNIELDFEGENIQKEFEKLQNKGIVSLKDNTIKVLTIKWINFFIEKLQEEFVRNNINVTCNFNMKNFQIEFLTNGRIKKFNIGLSDDCNLSEDVIFMCKPNLYQNKLYWLELINDINLLNLFYAYLINQVNNMNKYAYRQIDIFEGIHETHISEIYNNSLKNYYIKKGKQIINYNQEHEQIIYKMFGNDNNNYYGVKFDELILWILKKANKIIFITIMKDDLIYSDEINNEIDSVKEKLNKKVSEYRHLMMYKENNIIDNSFKLISGLTTYFMPMATIINILCMFKIDSIDIKSYKWILSSVIAILFIIQFFIIKLIYVPAFKISKFKWEI